MDKVYVMVTLEEGVPILTGVYASAATANLDFRELVYEYKLDEVDDGHIRIAVNKDQGIEVRLWDTTVIR